MRVKLTSNFFSKQNLFFILSQHFFPVSFFVFDIVLYIYEIHTLEEKIFTIIIKKIKENLGKYTRKFNLL